MKLLPLLVTVLGLCLTVLPAPRAQAETEVTFDYFYEALAPYGTWVEVEGYGSCWSPNDVGPDWAPYTEGEWVFTDGGWTWMGDEPFAGIVYHYGRWILAGSQGWCWMPGYEWAPAWVAWRDSDEYIGWAPLPPEVAWEPDQGVGIWVDEVYGIGPAFYNFCHHRDFGAHHLRSVLLARSWNTTILVQTVNITNLCYNRRDRVVYCGGPSYDKACRYAGHPIAALRLDRRDDFSLRDGKQPLPGGHVAGNTLTVVAPRVRPSPEKNAAFPKAAKVIGHSQVNLGWAGRGASGDLDSVRRKIRAEAQGHTPKTAPAKAVEERELAVIPSQPGRAARAEPAAQPAVVVPPVASSSPIPQQPSVTPMQSVIVHQPPSGGVVSTVPAQAGPPSAQMPDKEVPAINNSRYERQMAPQPLSSNAFTRQQQQQQLQAAAHAEVERRQAQELARQQAETAKVQMLQRGRDAMERQRQEQSRMQVQAQAQAQAEAAARQQQQQLQAQRQQQAAAAVAAAARDREIRAEQQQRRAAMQSSPPPLPPVVRQAPVSTPPPSSSSSSRSDDRDDRHKKR